MAGAHIAGEMRRDLETDIGATFSNLARELLDVLHFSDNPEGFGVDEAIQELTALDRPILIQDRHGHVLYVVVEGVAERNHFDERGKEHKKKRDRIAQNRDELLEEDGAEAAERCALHSIRLPFFVCSRWRVSQKVKRKRPRATDRSRESPRLRFPLREASRRSPGAAWFHRRADASIVRTRSRSGRLSFRASPAMQSLGGRRSHPDDASRTGLLPASSSTRPARHTQSISPCR